VAPPAGTLRVGRYFLALLAILAVLYAITFWPGSRHTPKLGLDLVGGTEVTFTAKTPNGSAPSRSSMTEAKTIMENRVNGSGVTESTVVIQGNNQIVISIPKSSNTDVAALGKAAVLSMRGAVMPPQPVACVSSAGSGATPTTPTSSGGTTPSPSPTGSASAGVKDAASRRLAPTPTSTPKPTTKATPTPAPSPSSSAPPAPKCVANSLAALKFAIPTTEPEYDKLQSAQKQQLQQALSATDCTRASEQPETAKTYVACDDGRTYGQQVAYLFGPTIVPGNQISGASAVPPDPANGRTAWTVSLDLKGGGQKSWADYTGAHNLGGTTQQIPSALQCGSSSTSCAVYVGFVLDGQVISAPANETAINGQTTQISGSFTQTSARKLANELKYGALPLSFTAQDAQSISASLGSSQLKAGLLAGGIGLVLVVIYSLLYYRALGLVTIASLVVSGLLTYGSLVMLGTQIGFTLSLAGIAGFIVAVGITADSFVVFFERLKDEVHEGRSVRVAVPRAWVRARRTILSADTVSFLAAAILYYFAAGDVKGFAFTLGLSTILDLIVVFLFTHPTVSLLSRSRAFGSARFTGLDALRGGAPATEPASARPPVSARRERRSAEQPEVAQSAVAVLDESEPTVTEDDGTSAEPSDDAEPRERRRTAPAAGSAAERAAARRARMRDERGDR
jgi:preprotein translocase subunit SecD